MELTTIFYHTDEFCKQFEELSQKRSLTDGCEMRKRAFSLTLSEVMTIMIYFPCSGYKSFKDYYTRNNDVLKKAFPGLVSYNRFIELQQKAAIPMALFLRLSGLTDCSGISFIDSFVLKSCHIKRQSSHKTFKGIAAKGKTSVGWFYGLKVHFLITPHGEIIDFYITSGNVADNNHDLIKRMSNRIIGKVFGDKGYILGQEITQILAQKGVQFITKVRANMKNRLLNVQDRLVLAKRGVIESVIAILKEDLSIEHTRHRNTMNFFAHVCSSLMAYYFRPFKPSIANKLISIA